jgi:RNA polymerase sigma-70 factor (ECF subfamily)
MTDDNLVEGCINKNINAQRELYERYAPKMLSVCIRYMCNDDDARDAMHDGFIKLFDKISKFEQKGSLDGWVRKFFVNTCLEKLRKSKKNSFQSINNANDGMQLLDNSIENADIQIETNELLNFVKNLPEPFRSIFNLYAIEGYSHVEIAEMLNITSATSRSNYFRARLILQSKIKLIM